MGTRFIYVALLVLSLINISYSQETLETIPFSVSPFEVYAKVENNNCFVLDKNVWIKIPFSRIDSLSNIKSPKDIPIGPEWTYPGTIRNHLVLGHGIEISKIQGWSRRDMERLHNYLHNYKIKKNI